MGKLSLVRGSGFVVDADGDVSLTERPDAVLTTLRGVWLQSGGAAFEVAVVRSGPILVGWAAAGFLAGTAPSLAGTGRWNSPGSLFGEDGPSYDGGSLERGARVLCVLERLKGDAARIVFVVSQRGQQSIHEVPLSGDVLHLQLCPIVGFKWPSQIRLNSGTRPFEGRWDFSYYASVQDFVWKCLQDSFVRTSPGVVGRLEAVSGKADVTIRNGRVTPERAFPTVMCTGVLLTHAKWYYEVRSFGPVLAPSPQSSLRGHYSPRPTPSLTALTLPQVKVISTNFRATQIGWADLRFSASSFKGNGIGDDSHSWAMDGTRHVLR
jgi:hypothetical protein